MVHRLERNKMCIDNFNCYFMRYFVGIYARYVTCGNSWHSSYMTGVKTINFHEVTQMQTWLTSWTYPVITGKFIACIWKLNIQLISWQRSPLQQFMIMQLLRKLTVNKPRVSTPYPQNPVTKLHITHFKLLHTFKIISLNSILT